MFTPETPTTTEAPTQAYPGNVAAPALPFDLAPGEEVKRTYTLVNKRKLLTQIVGVLFVTDSRVIYTVESKGLISRGKAYEEVQVQDVAGVGGAYVRGIRLLWLLLGIIAAIAALMMLTMLSQGPMMFLFFLLFAIAAVVCLMIGWSRRARLLIRARGELGSGVSIAGGTARGIGAAAFDRLYEADPIGLDAVTQELSALILDIQARGRLAS